MSTKPTVLITGASSGIGKELAKLFALDGYKLVLVARNKDKLESLARELKKENDVFVKVIVMDLEEVGAAKKVFEKVEGANLEVEILVNNAGFALFGGFEELDLEDQVALVQVNVVALMELTYWFLPGMLKRKTGKVLNVASTASYLPGPLMSVYYASKHFVLAFSESLENEVGSRGVQVTTLVPGMTKTGFQKRAGMSKLKILRSRMMGPEEVALRAYRGLEAGEKIIVVGWFNRLIVWLPRVLPRNWLVKVSRWVQERKKKGSV